MKNYRIFSLLAAFLLISLIGITEGLDCYSCWSEASMPDDMYPHPRESAGIMGHKSCQKGMTPHPDLAVTCPSVADSDGNEIEPVCIELYANFSVWAAIFHRKVLFTLALRGCFHVNSTVEDLTHSEPCSQRTYRNLADMAMGDVAKILDRIPEAKLPNGTTGELCYCNRDNCNGAASRADFINAMSSTPTCLLERNVEIVLASLAVLVGFSLFA